MRPCSILMLKTGTTKTLVGNALENSAEVGRRQGRASGIVASYGEIFTDNEPPLPFRSTRLVSSPTSLPPDRILEAT